MDISVAVVKKTAALARIAVADDAAPALATQLSAIIDYIEQLNTLDTAAVTPLSHVLTVTNVLRADECGVSLSQTAALKNAPEQENGCVKVPKTI